MKALRPRKVDANMRARCSLEPGAHCFVLLIIVCHSKITFISPTVQSRPGGLGRGTRFPLQSANIAANSHPGTRCPTSGGTYCDAQLS